MAKWAKSIVTFSFPKDTSPVIDAAVVLAARHDPLSWADAPTASAEASRKNNLFRFIP
jgi:hypothetical protein